MAYTGILGTGASYLGNFVLGSGDGAEPTFSVGADNTLALSSQASVSVTYNLLGSNTFTINSVAGQAYLCDADNTITFAGVAEAENEENTEVENVLIFSQTATASILYEKSAQNTFTISQSALYNAEYAREASNTIVYTDLALKVLDETPSHTLTLSHTAVTVKYRNASANNSLVFGHAVTVNLTTNYVLMQTLVVQQTLTKSMMLARSATSSLVVTQQATAQASKLAQNTIVFSGECEGEYSYGSSVSIEFTQITNRLFTANRNLYSNFIPFQILALDITIRRTVEDELVLSQLAEFEAVRPTASLINFTHSAEAINCKAGSNVFNIIAFSYTTFTLGLPTTNELILETLAEVTKSRAVSASNAFGMNQFSARVKVLSLSADNTLTMVSEVVRERFNRSINQSLTLSQAGVGNKVAERELTQQLTLGHTLGLSKTMVRSVGNTLVFKPSYQRRAAISGGTIIEIPGLQVVKVEPLVVLQSGNDVIVLKPPEFGDTEGGDNRINIKRSMDGAVRVYKRTSPSTKLSYSFVMDRLKALELRAFILANNSKVLKMTNWKGEIWAVNLTNNPFAFNEESRREGAWGNRSSINLEFEGIKTN